jgi:hypothetical protein
MSAILKIIANRLSILYGGPHFGPCACAGIACGCTSCSAWWEMVLQDKEIQAQAIKFYENNKESIESGVLKILANRFLLPV